MENVKMQFVVSGFSHAMGFRVFSFEGIAADRSRQVYTVKADLALSRKHGIQLQDLPLLCRGLLERQSGPDYERAFECSEDDMRVHSEGVLAAKQRKAARRPMNSQFGASARRDPQAGA